MGLIFFATISDAAPASKGFATGTGTEPTTASSSSSSSKSSSSSSHKWAAAEGGMHFTGERRTFAIIIIINITIFNY